MARENDSGRIRVRASGILARDDSILMVKLQSPVRSEPIWLPPGGSVKKGETLEQAAVREIREETGIRVKTAPRSLCLIHEFIEPPLHAVEFYFRVHETGGNPNLGADPELNKDAQILLDTIFMPIPDFNQEDIYPEYLREHIRELIIPGSELQHIRSVK